MNVVETVKSFFRNEKSGGIVLLACTVLSLAVSSIAPAYSEFWKQEILGETIRHQINHALMALFFLSVGLDLEHEIYEGELSSFKRAIIPIIAAAGGMIIPGAIYYLINLGEGKTEGFGVAMATDIAFALAVLSLLGKRVPDTLKIFLAAFAVMDDVGTILIIAVFYSKDVKFAFLLAAAGLLIIMFILNRKKVYSLWPYIIGGLALWYCFERSGVHATISGVLLALTIPFGNGGDNSPSHKLEKKIQWPVAFLVLPIFALANTAIPINEDLFKGVVNPITLGILFGLFFGKPIGIWLLCWMGVRFKWGELPEKVTLAHIAGTGFLGGIGFTMSMFIGLLAFDEGGLLNQAKIAILITSLLAGVVGYVWLRRLKGSSDGGA